MFVQEITVYGYGCKDLLAAIVIVCVDVTAISSA